MIKQLVSDIGIFAQKLKVFLRPLHFKEHAPSLLCLSTNEGAWSYIYYRKDDGQHYFSGIIFNMTYTHPNMKESNQIGKIYPYVCL